MLLEQRSHSGDVAQSVRAPISNCKVASSMSSLGIELATRLDLVASAEKGFKKV